MNEGIINFKMIQVSIIIVNYNTKTLLLNCINSIIENTSKINYEIIVVDNASVDGSQEYIRTNFPEVVLIESKENLGFGRANNLGLKSAFGKFVFFLNSDTILLNDAVNFFLDFHNDHKCFNVGVLGCVLYDENHRPNSSYGDFKTAFGDILYIIKCFFVKKVDQSDNNSKLFEYKKVDWVCGADMFISKTILDRYGAFDENFFMYSEEVDMQKRFVDNKLSNYLISSPKIIHLEGGSSTNKEISISKRIIIDSSRFIYYKNHSSILGYILYRVLYFFIFFVVIVFKDYPFPEKLNYIKNLLLHD
jgi:GT2 family glycosyltransferase